MAPDRNWAIAGFDVLIVHVFFFLIPKKQRLTDGTNMTDSEERGNEDEIKKGKRGKRTDMQKKNEGIEKKERYRVS